MWRKKERAVLYRDGRPWRFISYTPKPDSIIVGISELEGESVYLFDDGEYRWYDHHNGMWEKYTNQTLPPKPKLLEINKKAKWQRLLDMSLARGAEVGIILGVIAMAALTVLGVVMCLIQIAHWLSPHFIQWIK